MKHHNNQVPPTMGTTYVRQPLNEAEQLLLDSNWEFAGTSLFAHTLFEHKFFTAEQALKINDEVKNKCVVCGMCANIDCCPPEECKCLYKKMWKER